ncbi:hypothetical protein TrVE_jg8380 [Triparma verrucosa]|uniref:Uncharacterized protein n=1 Tax=Triparma verrucosa TaxID=1606542 RepID=A0A9W7FAD0_9STRA|nr:hypothetical protein TrVE_jg8380 [Triparma verrucosa]
MHTHRIDVKNETEQQGEGEELKCPEFPTSKPLPPLPLSLLSSYFSHQTLPLKTLPLHSCSTALYLLTPSDNFTTLLNSPLPKNYTDLFNPKHLTRHFLVLTEGDDGGGGEYVKNVKKKHPHLSITHLPLNSSPTYDPSLPNLWSPSSLYNPLLKSSHYGGRLSPHTLTGLLDYFKNLALSIIVSHERTLNNLFNTVTEKRKGFKNIFKTLITTKKPLTLTSQTLHLSLELYRLGFYKEAVYWGGIVKGEYKGEGKWGEYAGAGEIVLWCEICRNGPDSGRFLKECIEGYLTGIKSKTDVRGGKERILRLKDTQVRVRRATCVTTTYISKKGLDRWAMECLEKLVEVESPIVAGVLYGIGGRVGGKKGEEWWARGGYFLGGREGVMMERESWRLGNWKGWGEVEGEKGLLIHRRHVSTTT